MSVFNRSQSCESCFLFPAMGLQWAHGWFWAMWPQAICYEDALGKIFFPNQKRKVSLSPLLSLPPILPPPLLTARAEPWSPLAFRAQACKLSHCPPGALVCTEEIVGLLSLHSPMNQFPLINLYVCVCMCVCICTHTYTYIDKDGDGDKERCPKSSLSWRILIQMLVPGLVPEKQNFKDEFSELVLECPELDL